MLTRLQAAKLRAPPPRPYSTPFVDTPLGHVLATVSLITYMVVGTYVGVQYGPALVSAIPIWLWIPLFPFIVVIAWSSFLTVAFLATAHR